MSYWLAASFLSGIGPIRFKRWVQQFETIEAFFNADRLSLEVAGLSEKEIAEVKHPDWKKVETVLKRIEQMGASLLTWEDPRYPRLLKEVSDAPLVLYVLGHPEVLSLPQIAMVGTRSPTSEGRKLASDFARVLAQKEWVITSGLALGVDAAAHQGALEVSGKTIAVMGTGLNECYPKSHRPLADKICEEGALVTEFELDDKPHASHFPRRNRLISGLSVGVLVVEAALRSGSLITARYAVEQGREVFAIPGSIHNPLARGCHYLIRQGAKLVETAEDILEELGVLVEYPPEERSSISPVKKTERLDPLYAALLNEVGFGTTAIDTLIAQSGLTASEVSSMLLILELEGHIKAVPGGYRRAST